MQFVNLVQVIYHLIAEQNPYSATRWLDTAPVIKRQSLHEQVVLINRYWREELGMLTIDTTKLRLQLSDDTEPNAWLSNFEQYLIPFILTYHLPFRKG